MQFLGAGDGGVRDLQRERERERERGREGGGEEREIGTDRDIYTYL